jgi:hypothetical protein
MLNDYGKEIFKPWCSVQSVVAALAVLFLMTLGITHFSLNSSEIASWVQAIGSIAAIWGAFTVGNNQVKRQEEQRLLISKQKSKALFAVVKHAVDHAKGLKELLAADDGQNNVKLAWNVGYSEIFKASLKSLSLIPAHELGEYELVIAHNHILAAMINITQKIEKFVITENFTEREIQVFRLELAGHFIFIDNFWRAFEQHYANMR